VQEVPWKATRNRKGCPGQYRTIGVEFGGVDSSDQGSQGWAVPFWTDHLLPLREATMPDKEWSGNRPHRTWRETVHRPCLEGVKTRVLSTDSQESRGPNRSLWRSSQHTSTRLSVCLHIPQSPLLSMPCPGRHLATRVRSRG